jgi:tRNA dimethylallyltransferase
MVILGPTASGKSALALALAERWNAEILSADSMQVYRGMDIGTAKPTPAERRRVRHHLIDVVEPTEPFTVARFVELADAVIDDARARRVPLIVTGGTPLYYKALFEGLFDGPSADESLRDRLRELDNATLHARLARVDPVAAERIHVNDTKRLVRALEVFELTGKPISLHQTEWADGPMRHEACWFGLNWEREALNRRINARVKQMIADGWLEEVRALLARHGELSATASEATGYAELITHLRGEISLHDAVEQIKIATRQLARRQMKWLRRWRQVRWLDGSLGVDELVAAVERTGG